MNFYTDTATWDAGDIRYNVLRWTSSPSPIFGGYGPSFVNPRTGQILGSDIMLEYAFVTNRFKQEKLFDIAGLHDDSEDKIFKDNYCTASDHLHQATMLGKIALDSDSMKISKDEFMRQSIYFLVLHELGHTLGLNHNMRASQMLKPNQVNSKGITAKTGIVASVMDYPTVNIALDKSIQGDYFTSKPGPYDNWAIDYGYREFQDSVKETKGLDKILARSTEPALAFGNDADDMRTPGLHIDPRVMINELTSDAIGYMTDRIKLVNRLSENLIIKYAKNGNSYHELRNAYLMLSTEHSNAAQVISRYVGGVYVERFMVGQKPSVKPFTPVSYVDQKRALNASSAYVFSPNAFKTNDKIYNYLQIQRRGFSLMGQNEDPKIHERVLNIQKGVLDHWLHPQLLKRLTDTQLYGNTYKLSEFLSDLTASIFNVDISKPNTFRQNIQIEYVNRIASIVKSDNPSYDNIAKANLVYQLNKIQKLFEMNKSTSGEMMTHRNYILFLIKKGLAIK